MTEQNQNDKTAQKQTEKLPKAVKTSAENWLNKHIKDRGRNWSFADIEQALEEYAQTVTSGTFRRMRNDLERYYCVKAKQYPQMKNVSAKIAKIQNPVPVDQRKKKPVKCKTVKEDDFEKLMLKVLQKQDEELMAALIGVKITGARPCELHTIKMFQGDAGETVIRIKGGKEAVIQGKQRGFTGPREIIMLDKKDIAYMKMAIPILKNLKSTKLNNTQRRLTDVTKKLWPRRKKRPTLKSFRHQLGSDLKASGLSEDERSAIMGHKSQDSISVYGYRNSGKNRSLKPTDKTIAQVKLEKTTGRHKSARNMHSRNGFR